MKHWQRTTIVVSWIFGIIATLGILECLTAIVRMSGINSSDARVLALVIFAGFVVIITLTLAITGDVKQRKSRMSKNGEQ